MLVKNLLIYECEIMYPEPVLNIFLCIVMWHSCFYYSIWHFLSRRNCFKNDISLCDHKLSSSKKHYHWDTNRHLQTTDTAKSQFNICYSIICHYNFQAQFQKQISNINYQIWFLYLLKMKLKQSKNCTNMCFKFLTVHEFN